MPLKVATWNVNGIRARAPEVLKWIERESPDLVCLQEIKASPEHVPVPLCDLSGYWCFWHGHKGYSGVSLHLRKSTFPGRPRFIHPEFDHEKRDVHPKLRKTDQIGTTPLERELFAKILARGLVDLQRKFAPDDDRLFSWWAPWRNLRERNIGWRIDYVLASTGLAEKATSCAGVREVGTSDHGPLQAVFDVPAPSYEPAPEPEPAPERAAPSPAQIPLL